MDLVSNSARRLPVTGRTSNRSTVRRELPVAATAVVCADRSATARDASDRSVPHHRSLDVWATGVHQSACKREAAGLLPRIRRGLSVAVHSGVEGRPADGRSDQRRVGFSGRAKSFSSARFVRRWRRYRCNGVHCLDQLPARRHSTQTAILVSVNRRAFCAVDQPNSSARGSSARSCRVAAHSGAKQLPWP